MNLICIIAPYFIIINITNIKNQFCVIKRVKLWISTNGFKVLCNLKNVEMNQSSVMFWHFLHFLRKQRNFWFREKLSTYSKLFLYQLVIPNKNFSERNLFRQLLQHFCFFFISKILSFLPLLHYHIWFS